MKHRFCAFFLIFVSFVSSMVFVACSSDDAAMCKVERIDLLMASLRGADSAQVAEAVAPVRAEVDAMMMVTGVQNASVADIEAWCNSKVVSMFQPAVDTVWSDTKALEAEVGKIMANARRQSLGLPELSFATVVWGSMRPIVRVDTIVLIALNHYLGADFEGYNGFNAYKRAEKTPAMLPYDLAAALAATQHPMQASDNATMLQWMLYEGALAEVRMRIVPNASEAMALGVTEQQLDILKRRGKELWQEMAARKLVYDTDPLTIDQYLGASAGTPLLGGAAPARVGRYIGYRIVKAWLATHKDAALSTILSPGFYMGESTLVESRFSGE